MKILNIVCLILIITLQSCKSQTRTESETLTIEEFHWTVTIPENFEPINPEEWNKQLNKGKTAMENAIELEIENNAVTIFTYRNEQFSNFEANWQPFDTEVDGDYLETSSAVNEMLYQTLVSQMPDAKLDTVSSIQKVSGLEFRRFDIVMDLPNGLKMKTKRFSRLFDKKEFTVNITSGNQKVGQKMLDAFLTSTFE